MVLISLNNHFNVQIGLKYEEENEDDLKDHIDFMQRVEAIPGIRKYN